MANPVLVNSIRGNTIESFHRGAICLLDFDGKIFFKAGDENQLTFPRSALKPFQQVELIISGAAEQFGLTEKEIAVTMGSHNGEPEHEEAVRSILHKIGLKEENLGCGPQLPGLKKDRLKQIEKFGKPHQIHNNCSGKHAGFLALCVFNSWSIDNYLEFNHPLQIKIRKWVEYFHDTKVEERHYGIDGCSAPIYAIPIYNQALGYANLGKLAKEDSKLGQATKRLINIFMNEPFMIAGSRRYCTDLMKTYNGKLMGKTGAEGIFSLLLNTLELACTIKVDDGKMGPQYSISQLLINNLYPQYQELNDSLDHYLEPAINNWAKGNTGKYQPSSEIKRSLEGLQR